MTYLSTWRRGGGTALAREILRDAPRAYWILNETSGQAQDSSGNGYHSTTASGIVYADQPLLGDSISYALFNGATSRFSRAGTLGLTMPYTGDYTFQCVFMATDNSGSNPWRLFSFAASGETEATNFQLSPQIDANGNPSDFWEHGAGVNVSATLVRYIYNSCRPIHLAFVRDSSAMEMRFYAGGMYLGRQTYANAPSGGGSCATYLGYNTSNTGVMWMGHAAFWNSIVAEDRILAWHRASGLRGF